MVLLCRNFRKPCPEAVTLRVLQSSGGEAVCPSCGSPLIRVPMAPKPWPGMGRFLLWFSLIFLATVLVAGSLVWIANPRQLRERTEFQNQLPK
ncbi:hypothetical protein EBZ02_05265 [bacterium]|nr:hypothetical protein [bacterium]NDA10399.1 hypothetical protein [Verrucomicrobiota bacterium]